MSVLPRALRRLAAAAALAAIALLGAALPASADSSGTGPAEPSLAWGVKESFRTYVTGPIAHGAITVSDGAATLETGYGFAQTASTLDESFVGQVDFGGAVTFTGHEGELDLTFAHPRLEVVDAETGYLSVATGEDRIVLAQVALGAATRTATDTTVTWADAPATLTQDGAAVFSYQGSAFYEPGTALDALTVTATWEAPAPVGALSWGVKESFVSYVEGPIAHGEIAVDGGAAREGATFAFAPVDSTVDAEYRGTASYGGAVHFWGHAGELDVTFADPAVEVRDDAVGYLSVDVNGERVVMAQLDLSKATRTAADGIVTWAAAPAALTVDGTAVFALDGSPFYEAGTALAPVTFSSSFSTTGGGDGGTGGGDGGGTGGGTGGGSGGGTGGGDGGSGGSGGGDTSTPPAVIPDRTDLTVGSLVWGVKASFLSYITGPIAHGAFTASSGATYSNGRFVFVQDGAYVDPASGSGIANFGGAVRFTGHAGLLDLTLSNPSVRLEGASRASLMVTVNGVRTALATLDLAAGQRSTEAGVVTLAGVPATLTGAGSAAFSGNGSTFYSAGTAMAPVTVTFGAPAPAAERPTSTQSVAAPVEEPETEEAPEEGEYQPLDIDPETLATLLRGGTVTIDAAGFAPGEAVQVVLYSDPLILADLTADASGTASWTGALPASVSGEHDLVFVGESGTRFGVALDIPVRATQAGMCLVDGGTVEWAFKDSFLAYIDSSIAHGTWEASDGAEDQGVTFVWPVTGGAIDPELGVGTVELGGTVHFTGHDGALDTTIANPTLEISADGTALLLDLATTTREGKESTLTQVRFGTLDREGGGIGVTESGLEVVELPAVLAPQGADAFGTYKAGDELAPVSAELVGEDCLGVLAGEAVAAEEPEAEPEPVVEDQPVAAAQEALPVESSEGGVAAGWWALAGLSAIAAAAGAVFWIRRRA